MSLRKEIILDSSRIYFIFDFKYDFFGPISVYHLFRQLKKYLEFK